MQRHFFLERLAMKQTNALILCLPVLFSVQTQGASKWREQISRHLPFTTTYKTEKLDKQRRKEFAQKLNSMDTHELVALDSELKSKSYDIGTIEEMKQLAREEIYARIAQNGQGEILEILAKALKARLGSVLNDEKTAPQFFEIFQDAARGNPPKAYRNILKEFFLTHTEAILALRPGSAEIGILSRGHILARCLDENFARNAGQERERRRVFFPSSRPQRILIPATRTRVP